MLENEAIVVAEALTKRFANSGARRSARPTRGESPDSLRSRPALDGLSFHLRRGEIYGLLGPNGAGKTTTTKILITLLAPDSGRAIVCGFDVVLAPETVRASIGYVSQEVVSDPLLTGRENLFLHGRLYHLPAALLKERIETLLQLVDLTEAADRPVKGYSGGMKKKLDIACGLIHEPQLLLLDEPSLGLDVESRQAIWRHIADLRRRGVSILLCTNYMDEADRLCDRIGIIDHGMMVVEGTPKELKSKLGGDVVTMRFSELNDGQRSGIETALRGQPGVKSLLWENSPNPVHTNPSMNIFVESNEAALPRLLEAIHRAGVAVQSVSYSGPTLDEVFLKFAGRRFAQEEKATNPQ
jgi:ABC-2 type transport system ATP-binding protein